MNYSNLKATAIATCEISARLVFAGVGIYALISGSFVGAFIALIGALLSTKAGRDKFLPHESETLSLRVIAGAGAAILLVSIGFGTVASVQKSTADKEAAEAKAVSDAAAQKSKAVALAESNRLEQQQKEAHLVEQKNKLAKLEVRMDALFQRDRNSVGWDSEALEIAQALNSLYSMEAPVLLEKWRTNPKVIAAGTAAVRQVRVVLQQTVPVLVKSAQKSYAEKVDRILLDGHVEAEVRTNGLGTNKATVTIRSAFVGRVFMDQLTNKGDMINSATNLGFSQIKFVNTISDEVWTYQLEAPQLLNTSEGEFAARRRWALTD